MSEEEREAARALGLTDEQLAQSFGEVGDDDPDTEAPLEIYPENHAALEWFLALETQWRILLGMSAVYYQGLRYDIAVLMMREAGLRRRERHRLLADLRIMEGAALPLLNEPAQ